MTTFDYASLGNHANIIPHLTEHSTLPQIMFALGFFDSLTVKQLQNRGDVVSPLHSPLYLAVGLLAAANTTKTLNRQFEQFEKQIDQLDNMFSGTAVEKAYYILWLNGLYMDVSAKAFSEHDFFFQAYPEKIKYIQYQDPGSSHGFRLELSKIDDVIYKNLTMWHLSLDEYFVEHFETHQFDILNYDDADYDYMYIELYNALPGYYLRDNAIIDFLNLLSDVHINIENMGRAWFTHWLQTTLNKNVSIDMSNFESPAFVSICTLLKLDVVAVKEQLDILCKLGLLDKNNMSTYLDSIYDAGRNSLTFNKEDLSIVDFDLLI